MRSDFEEHIQSAVAVVAEQAEAVVAVAVAAVAVAWEVQVMQSV